LTLVVYRSVPHNSRRNSYMTSYKQHSTSCHVVKDSMHPNEFSQFIDTIKYPHMIYSIYQIFNLRTERFHYDRNRLQLIRLSRCEKNGRNMSKDMIKLFFFMTTLGLMSLSHKKIFGNIQMGCFTAPAVFLRTLLFLIIDCSEGCSKSPVHFFRRNRKLAPKLNRLQRRIIFSRWNSKIVW